MLSVAKDRTVRAKQYAVRTLHETIYITFSKDRFSCSSVNSCWLPGGVCRFKFENSPSLAVSAELLSQVVPPLAASCRHWSGGGGVDTARTPQKYFKLKRRRFCSSIHCLRSENVILLYATMMDSVDIYKKKNIKHVIAF